MTIASQNARVTLATNGVGTAFPLVDETGALYFAAASDLVVTWIDADGNESDLFAGTDYNVTGDGTVGDGTLTTVGAGSPRADGTLTVRRQTSLDQQFTWSENDGNPSARFSAALDRRALIDQEAVDMAARALRVAPWEAPLGEVPYDRAGTILGFDSSKQPIALPVPAGPSDLSASTFSLGITGTGPQFLIGKFKEMLSIKDFGATGDGADDTSGNTAFAAYVAALVAAGTDTYAAKGRLYMPAGDYVLTGQQIKKFGIEIVGDGPFATRLINKDASAAMLTVASDVNSAIAGVNLRDLSVWNTVARNAGSDFLIKGTNLVRAFLENVRFTSSAIADDSHLSALYCNMLKLDTSFEIEFARTYWNVGIGCPLEIVDDAQADTALFRSVEIENWAGAARLWLGNGGNGCNNFQWLSGKLLGFQGGTFISGTNDAFCKTTVNGSVSNSNVVTLHSVTGIAANRTIVFGQNTVNPVVASVVSVNAGAKTVTLDVSVTVADNAYALSGTILAILGHMHSPRFQGVQLEGADIGILNMAAQDLQMEGWSASSVIKPVYHNCEFRGFKSQAASAGTSGSPRNAIAWKLITLDGMTDVNNRMLMLGNGMVEGSGYYVTNAQSLVDNLSTQQVARAIEDRVLGMTYSGGNSGATVPGMVFRDSTDLIFDMEDNTQFVRMLFQAAGVNKFSLALAGTNPDLFAYLVSLGAGSPSWLISGVTGVVQFGGAWNGPHITLGAYHLWVDGSGKLRIKSGAPANDTDGTVVGTQS